jgi:citrate lyase beta subunit
MSLRSIVRIGPAGEGLNEALGSEADAILLTVATDARPVNALRNTAREALVAARDAGKLGLVLVNHPRTQLLRDDLDLLTAPELAGVLVNNTLEPQDLRDTAVLLREFELNRDIEPGAVAVYGVVRTARALLRAGDLVQATNRVAGLVFDGDAYAHDIGARAEESGPRLAYARGALVAATRARDGLPLAVASPRGLRETAQYGFAGAILADAASAPQANVAFAPTDAAKDRAARHIAAYEAARAEGLWVARDGEDVVDSSSVRKARQLLG